MYSRADGRPVRARELMFAVCALCTLWLVAQNALLLALVPWERIACACAAIQQARPWMVGVVAIGLVPAAFAAGWLAARAAARSAEDREGRDA